VGLFLLYCAWIYISLYGIFIGEMAIVTQRKKKPVRTTIKPKKSDYQKYVVEPAKRLLTLIDESDVKR